MSPSISPAGSKIEKGRRAHEIGALQRASEIGVTGTVHWDLVGTWNVAQSRFLPQYAHAGGPVRGIFAVNVPYLAPAFSWPQSQFFKLVSGADGSQIALFRPREWRGR